MLPGFVAMNPLRRLAGRPGRRESAPRPSPDTVLDARHQSDLDSGDELESPSHPGHAVDVLQLLSRNWFGSEPKGKPHSRSARQKASASSSPQLKPALDGRQPAAAPAPSPLVLGNEQPAPANDAPAAKGPADAAPPAATSGRQVQPSAPVPTSLPQQQRQQESLPPEALAVQQLPGIGTWAGRQRLFAQPADLRGIPRTPSGGSPSQMQQLGRPGSMPDGDEDEGPVVLGATGALTCVLGQGAGAGGSSLSKNSSLRSEQAREAAWRWRFSRKWEAEQRKYYEEGGATGAAGGGSVISNDGLEAIQYTQACGMGENLQFEPPLARSSSRASNGDMMHSLSCQFDVSGHGGSGALSALAAAACSLDPPQQYQAAAADDGHPPRPPRPRGVAPWLSSAGEAAQPSATTAVLSMVTKARDLLQRQQQIEEEAQSRWDRSLSGGPDEEWAGQHLRPVHIGMSGRFRYVVLRAVDARGHQRYLVRGRSRSPPAELVEKVAQEAAVISKREGLPQLVIELVGGGVMEWREDTDRHLHLSAAASSSDSISAGAAGGAHSPKKGPMLGEVTGLAASLVRQALPCHFQISTTTAPSRMASLMDTLHI